MRRRKEGCAGRVGRRRESALGSRRSPNFLGVRSVFVLPRPTFLFAASTPSSSSSRRCHRLPRYPSLPSDVKRRAREAGYTARLAPSFCDLAPGVSRGWVAAFNLPRSRCLGPSRSLLSHSEVNNRHPQDDRTQSVRVSHSRIAHEARRTPRSQVVCTAMLIISRGSTDSEPAPTSSSPASVPPRSATVSSFGSVPATPTSASNGKSAGSSTHLPTSATTHPKFDVKALRCPNVYNSTIL